LNMPRRKAKKTRRRQSGISLIGLAETYMLLNVATQAAFNTNPVEFLVGKPAAGSANITLQELISPKGKFYDQPNMPGVQGPMYYIGSNLRKNGLMAAVSMVAIPVMFKLGKGIARTPISRTNRLLNKAGVGRTVKL